MVIAVIGAPDRRMLRRSATEVRSNASPIRAEAGIRHAWEMPCPHEAYPRTARADTSSTSACVVGTATDIITGRRVDRVSSSQDLGEIALARRTAGRALRRLGHALVGHDADTELLGDMATTLTRLTAQLDSGARRHRPIEQVGHRERGRTERGAAVESYDDRPFSGNASPWGLDLEVHRVGDEIEATVTLGAAHEGAPGRAHGGIIAGLFDDVFGFVLGVVGKPAFTGELKIRYLASTPLHRPLLCRGRLASQQGRKLLIEGELIDAEGDVEKVVARGTGLFITVDPAIFAETMELPAPPVEV
jgi:acyl-coenzyme A thioesterase PaaI-like protein